MERMGLWGDGAPFRSFLEFLETVQKKGLGELVHQALRPDTTVQNILFCFNIILTFCWLISKLIAYKC